MIVSLWVSSLLMADIHLSNLIATGMALGFRYNSRGYTEKVLHCDFPAAGSFYTEILFHKKGCMISCSYNPQKNDICRYLDIVTKTSQLKPEVPGTSFKGLLKVLMYRNFRGPIEKFTI